MLYILQFNQTENDGYRYVGTEFIRASMFTTRNNRQGKYDMIEDIYIQMFVSARMEGERGI